MRYGWRIVLGTFVGALGAAFGSVGGVGGGGIFVPMLTLIIGFDPKSSTAMSKCMIMGAAMSTVYYNLKLRHPTLDLPVIDYDLVLLIMPMLMLGISIGVIFNVVFPDWLVTVLLIILFIATSTKSFLKGVEVWKKETIAKMEAAEDERINDLTGTTPPPSTSTTSATKVSIWQNIYWREFALLLIVWIAFLMLQIIKNYTTTCSVPYWLLTLSQIPIAAGVTVHEAVNLYRGKRRFSSNGAEQTDFKIHKLCIYSFAGVFAGVVGGLLGLGGGFIMSPLFLELGIPPQVSSATATFAMLFSASMSAVEYYLLHRFPVPYAFYFTVVATVAAYVGQRLVRRVINMVGRASLIIFVLSLTILISALLLGGVGVSRMVRRMKMHENMGFEDLCRYH